MEGNPNELLLRCDCGEDHFICFQEWNSSRIDPTRVFSVLDTYRTPRGLWGRIKAALVIFLRGEYCRGDVVLYETNLRLIRDWCDENLHEEV